MVDYTWLFARGTLKAHVVISEEEGRTLCGRKGLKFEQPVANVYLDTYKCVTCEKKLREGSGTK
jgi:hypothetical protein